MYANKTADPYPAAAAACRELLASQLASPVAFTRMIGRMAEEGFHHFIEVGPGARLTALVSSILDGRSHLTAALDSSNGKRPGTVDLARLLAQAAAWGQPVNLELWDGGAAAVEEIASRKPARMPVSLTGNNHRSSKPSERTLVKPTAPTAGAAAPAAGLAGAYDLVSGPAGPNLIALQRLQEQTAMLHQKFLENQLAVHQTFERLLSGQPAAGLMTPPAMPFFAAAAVPAPAPALASAPTVAAPTPVQVSAGVEKILLAVVAEKTGYPESTLNMDMDLSPTWASTRSSAWKSCRLSRSASLAPHRSSLSI